MFLSMQSLIPFLTVIKSCHHKDFSFFHAGFRVMFTALNLGSDSDVPEKAVLCEKSSLCGQDYQCREQQQPSFGLWKNCPSRFLPIVWRKEKNLKPKNG